MKKILIALFRYQIGHLNASAISADSLASYLFSKKINIAVCCPKTKVKRKYKIINYNHHSWRERDFFLNMFKFIKKVNKIADNYDLLYLVLPNPALSYIADRIKTKKAKTIVRFECSLQHFKGFKFSFNKLGFYALLTRLASCRRWTKLSKFPYLYLVGTRYQKKELVSCGCTPKKIKILVSPAKKIRPTKPVKTEKIFSFIGHFNTVKGVAVLIKAINYLVDFRKVNNIKFKLASANNFYQKKHIAKSIENYRLEKYISISKTVNIESFLKNSKAIVLPFLYPFGTQLYPNLILESIQLCKPIITTTIKPLTELLTHKKNSVLIEPNNEKALAKAILELSNNKRLENKIIKNLKVLSEKYKPEILNEKHYLFFKNYLKKNG